MSETEQYLVHSINLNNYKNQDSLKKESDGAHVYVSMCLCVLNPQLKTYYNMLPTHCLNYMTGSIFTFV